jgi:hypothetical protein
MTKLLSVVETPAYLSKASKLLNENERAAVVDMIAAAPNLGVVMRGTGGLRKMRIPLMGRGKRGGGRISTGFTPTVFLQFCFGYSQRTRRPT